MVLIVMLMGQLLRSDEPAVSIGKGKTICGADEHLVRLCEFDDVKLTGCTFELAATLHLMNGMLNVHLTRVLAGITHDNADAAATEDINTLTQSLGAGVMFETAVVEEVVRGVEEEGEGVGELGCSGSGVCTVLFVITGVLFEEVRTVALEDVVGIGFRYSSVHGL